MDHFYEKVQEFHNEFHPSEHSKPTAYNLAEAKHRAEFKIEEIVEFIYASSENDSQLFAQNIAYLKGSLDKAVNKIQQKQKKVKDPLVEQVDALTDLLYLTYGSFVLMGVDPTEIFHIVHQANMGKKFPDGLAHFDPITHKILKPAHWEAMFAPENKIKKALEKQNNK